MDPSRQPVSFRNLQLQLIQGATFALFAALSLLGWPDPVSVCTALASALVAIRGAMAGTVVLATSTLRLTGLLRTRRIPRGDVASFEVARGPVGFYTRSYLLVKLNTGASIEFKDFNGPPKPKPGSFDRVAEASTALQAALDVPRSAQASIAPPPRARRIHPAVLAALLLTGMVLAAIAQR